MPEVSVSDVMRRMGQRLGHHRVSRDLNAWYFWGVILMAVLALQLLSGFFLLMHYVPSVAPNARGWSLAFASVFDVMHDVPWGWLLRYMHTTGASLIFLALYMHIVRAFLYGSYRGRRWLWYIGVTLFLCFVLEAFSGALLPWGQMSYWSARVITHVIALIPHYGPQIFQWLFGEPALHTEMLHRFFAVHVFLLPFFFLCLIVGHILALWDVGGSDPHGRPLSQQVTIPFHPYYTIKDACAVVGFLMVYFAIVFWCPRMGGLFIDPHNAIEANPFVTPTDIHPIWYFMPFYSMLRSVTAPFIAVLTILLFLAFALYYRGWRWWRRIGMAIALIAISIAFHRVETNVWGGVCLMIAPLMLYGLPSWDRSPVSALRYRPGWQRLLYLLFLLNFVALGILGYCDPRPGVIRASLVCTVFYFAFFLFMPAWSARGVCVMPRPAE